MHLYEMIGVADENGKTYISPYGTYNKKDGFNLCRIVNFAELLNILVHEDCWSLKIEKKKMTKAEIEKALGYEIDIISDNKTYSSFDDLIKELVRGGRVQ